ncbi:MAG: ATP-binding cassette domain-containing protein [Treponema sp.]
MIEVEHVSRQFGSFRAVDDISFSIQTGEIVGLLGPNGAGKTTTMRMITGFLEPTGGSVKIDGLDVVTHGVEAKRKIGYMPEAAPLYSDMIVADYLKYEADLLGVDAEEKVPHLAKICGLNEVMYKNISELSRGNKQRVGLAHALMGDPEILILDEPTSGLDPNQVSEVRSLIKEIGKTRTVIISTHILSEVEMLCNRVIIISKGKIAADSPTEELREKFGHSVGIKVTAGGCTAEELKSALSNVDGASSVTSKDELEKPQGESNYATATVGVDGEKEIRPLIAKAVISKGYNLYEMQIQKNSLEDVFRVLTTGGETNE